MRVSGVFSDSDDRSVLEGLLKDAPGVIPSFVVFESLTKPAVWVNATRSDVNKFYDMGFEVDPEETQVEALQRQLAEGGNRGLITPGYAPAGTMITRWALAGPMRF